MSNDLTYTQLLNKQKETEEYLKFLSYCIEEMESSGSLSTTSKIGMKLPKPYTLLKVELDLKKVESIKRIEGTENTYMVHWRGYELPMRVNESYIALTAFKYTPQD